MPKNTTLKDFVNANLSEAISKERGAAKWLTAKAKEAGIQTTQGSVAQAYYQAKRDAGVISERPKRQPEQPKKRGRPKKAQNPKQSPVSGIQKAERDLSDAKEKAKEAGSAFADMAKASDERDAERKKQLSGVKETCLARLDDIQAVVDSARQEIEELLPDC